MSRKRASTQGLHYTGEKKYDAVGDWSHRQVAPYDPYSEYDYRERDKIKAEDRKQGYTRLKGKYYADIHGNLYTPSGTLLYAPSEAERKEIKRLSSGGKEDLRGAYEKVAPYVLGKSNKETLDEAMFGGKAANFKKPRYELPPGESPYRRLTGSELEDYLKAHPAAAPGQQSRDYDLNPVLSGGAGGGGGTPNIPLVGAQASLNNLPPTNSSITTAI
jgi:hypothetical protein